MVSTKVRKGVTWGLAAACLLAITAGYWIHSERVRWNQELRLRSLLSDAWGFLDEGRLAKAEAVAREALRLAPNAPACYSTLGDVLAARGRYDEAVTQYEAETSRFGGECPSHLSEAVAAKQNLSRAKPLIEEVLKIDEEMWLGDCAVLMASIDPKRAVALADRCGNAAVYAGVAEQLAQRGDSLAGDMLKKASSAVESTHGEALLWMAEARRAAGQPADWDLYERALTSARESESRVHRLRGISAVLASMASSDLAKAEKVARALKGHEQRLALESVAVATAFTDPLRAQRLAATLPHREQEIVQYAIAEAIPADEAPAAARRIGDNYLRARALLQVSERIRVQVFEGEATAEALLDEVVGLLHKIPSDRDAVMLLLAIAEAEAGFSREEGKQTFDQALVLLRGRGLSREMTGGTSLSRRVWATYLVVDPDRAIREARGLAEPFDKTDALMAIAEELVEKPAIFQSRNSGYARARDLLLSSVE